MNLPRRTAAARAGHLTASVRLLLEGRCCSKPRGGSGTSGGLPGSKIGAPVSLWRSVGWTSFCSRECGRAPGGCGSGFGCVLMIGRDGGQLGHGAA